MLLILAPSASSWSEKPKSTLELMFELPHRAELMFPCSIQMAPRHLSIYLWYASEVSGRAGTQLAFSKCRPRSRPGSAPTPP